MTIWADADSLPKEVRELVARRASMPASGLRAVFVANRKLPLPPGANLAAVIVGRAGSTAQKSAPSLAATGQAPAEDADSYILAQASAGDIVVTRDIPLASRAIAQGIIALNDRGELWTADTVRERLSLRDHAEALRLAGLAPELNRGRLFGPKERGAFANALDKALLQARRGQEERP
jgi:uncharacterized protein